jgi:hypothetical protein
MNGRVGGECRTWNTFQMFAYTAFISPLGSAWNDLKIFKMSFALRWYFIETIQKE